MGREIRRVPPHWNHPGEGLGRPQPMYDKDYQTAGEEWVEEFIKWHVKKEYPCYAKESSKRLFYWDWESPPPQKELYRPWKNSEATWFQLWETVTEGTPVSPPFETLEELAQYLAANGDTWDQHYGKGGWGIERARAFCADGWCPTGAIIDGKYHEGTSIAAVLNKDEKKGA